MNRVEFRNDTMTKLIDNMVFNLPVLRARLCITQAELAEKMRITRQTLTLIESRKREMSWYMFLAFVMLFRSNDATRQMLEIFDIYTPELEYLLRIDD